MPVSYQGLQYIGFGPQNSSYATSPGEVCFSNATASARGITTDTGTAAFTIVSFNAGCNNVTEVANLTLPSVAGGLSCQVLIQGNPPGSSTPSPLVRTLSLTVGGPLVPVTFEANGWGPWGAINIVATAGGGPVGILMDDLVYKADKCPTS